MDAEHGASHDPDIDHERVVDRQVLPVRIHSTPRYGRFLWFGVIGGLVVAVVLTSVASQTEPRGGPMSTGASGVLWVFGVYALVAVAAGLLLMGLLVLLLARRSGRHARTARAVHDTTLVDDLRHPVTDEIPRWAVDADDLAPGDRPDRDGTAGGSARRRPPRSLE